MLKQFGFFLILFVWSGYAYSEDTTLVGKIPLRKSYVTGIVLPSRSPENGWYAQGGIIKVFKTDYLDSTLRASNIYLFGMYSQLNQFRISVGGEIFTPKEKYFIYSWIYYSYTPELFFGTGQDVTYDKNEFISYRVFYSQIDVLRKIKGHLFAGINTRIELPYDFEYADGGLFQHSYRNNEDFTVIGGGLRIRYDSRDNVLSTKSGSYIDFSTNAYNPWTNRQFQFTNYNLDMRRFYSVNERKRQVFAVQCMAKFSDGTTPFRYLPNITTRAYNPNLYKDNILLMARSEFRFAVYKFIGLSLFSGVGIVAPTANMISLNQTKWNIGGGFRFLVSPKYNMNLRVEYGAGEGTSNYYIAFTDAF